MPPKGTKKAKASPQRHVRVSEERGVSERRSPARNWNRNASPQRPAIRGGTSRTRAAATQVDDEAEEAEDDDEDQVFEHVVDGPTQFAEPNLPRGPRGGMLKGAARQRFDYDAPIPKGLNTRLAPVPRPGATRNQGRGKQLPTPPDSANTHGRGSRARIQKTSTVANPQDPRRDSAIEIPTVPARETRPTATKRKASTSAETSTIAGAEEEDKLDADVCYQLHQVRLAVRSFARSLPGLAKNVNKTEILEEIVVPANKRLVRYIGCLSMGGPRGLDGWKELLSDNECREALVHGVLGRALKEEVFDSLWFGGDSDQLRHLRDLQWQGREHDGFYRTKDRAAYCSTLHKKDEHCTGPAILEAKATLHVQLTQMFLPLFKQPNNPTATALPEVAADLLANAIDLSTTLSRYMRCQSTTIYHWTPVFKDEEFDPARMECLNLSSTMQLSPYETKEISGIKRAVLKKGNEHRDEAIVRVVCFPALTRYRVHGGALAEHLLEQERMGTEGHPEDVRASYARDRSSAQNLTGEEGYRTRVLGLSVVCLVWGKQRLLTKEAGTSTFLEERRSKGYQSKYEEDYKGFRELWDWAWEKWANEKLLGEVWDKSDEKDVEADEALRKQGAKEAEAREKRSEKLGAKEARQRAERQRVESAESEDIEMMDVDN